ncbi:MAG: hypothetical protein F6J98_00115 [Moorea sp. SIO4G2]|nr:hypothetical protein [Moorena sp. SIO4G2]
MRYAQATPTAISRWPWPIGHATRMATLLEVPSAVSTPYSLFPIPYSLFPLLFTEM